MKTLTFDESDLVVAYRLNLLRVYRDVLLKFGVKRFKILYIIGIIFWILMLIKSLFFGPFFLLASTLLPLFSLIPSVFVYYISLPKIAKKQIKHPPFSIPHNTHWDEHYLYTLSADTEGKSAWCIFSKIIESDSHILLYSQSCMFHIFPKRFFDSEDELQDFKNHALKGIAEYHLKNNQ